MSVPQRNSSKVITGSNFIEKIKEYIKAHKISSTIVITATISLTLSFMISISIITNVRSSYEVKALKIIEDTLKKDRQITDVQRTEIIRSLGFNTQNNTLITTRGNITITDDDKTKLIDYMVSNLTYYQNLTEQTNKNLDEMYNDLSRGYYLNDPQESIINKLENQRKEYKKEIDNMQETLFKFCEVDYKK